MHPLRLASLALLLAAAATTAASSQAPGYDPDPASPQIYGSGPGYDDRSHAPQMDVGFFYEELSPYGDWVYTRDFGWAWFPRDVRPSWRPYNDGRWVNSDFGWTWASYEPYGWATYHYGRWALDPRYGWIWVPGTIWGPAWVSWQHGGGYVGWAPLPPSVGFDFGIGLRLSGLDLHVGIRPDRYSFVSERSFLEPRLSGYLVPTARNVTIIHATTNVTNYTSVDNRVINRGVDVRRIELATGRRIPAVHVSQVSTISGTAVTDKELRVYRPGKSKLDTVRVGERANAGQRAEAIPAKLEMGEPAAQHRAAADVEVAPRAERSSRPSEQQVEKQERREQQELEQYQAEQKRKVAKLQQEEKTKPPTGVDRSQVDKSHQAELEELKQEQQNAAQQLEARQKAKRQAAKATPPVGAKASDEKQAADPKQGKKKDKGQPQKDESNGRGEKTVPPPPA